MQDQESEFIAALLLPRGPEDNPGVFFFYRFAGL